MNIKMLALVTAGLATALVAAAPLSAKAQQAPTDYNYVGIGVGVGDLGPNSDVGLAINSKFRVVNQVSVRPSVISDLDFSDDGNTQFTLPVTYDFNSPIANGRLLPFAGAGASFSTGRDEVGPMLTAGADYRINRRLTANGTVNVNFFDSTDVNGVVGLGYTF
jgi:hypothetical protein